MLLFTKFNSIMFSRLKNVQWWNTSDMPILNFNRDFQIKWIIFWPESISENPQIQFLENGYKIFLLRWEFYQGQKNWFCDIKWQQKIAILWSKLNLQYWTFIAKQSDQPKRL